MSRSTAALRLNNVVRVVLLPINNSAIATRTNTFTMGNPVDVAKLKEEKKRKKEEQKKLSQANKERNQLPPPKPIQRSFCAIPGNEPLPDAVGCLTVMSFNVIILASLLLNICLPLCMIPLDFRSMSHQTPPVP